MIKRILAAKAKYLAGKFPVVAVLGPRQSGKTTFVQDVFSGYDYVSLEDLDTRSQAVNDPREFLGRFKKKLIIDEAQRAPELFSYIQTVVDKRKKEGIYILTGSQNILLHEKLSQSLAGRVAILNLLPFSMEELRLAGLGPSSVESAVYNGFYPRIYDKKIKPVDWYPNYLRTYVERDIRLIKNISDLNIFQKFIKMCAARCGQILNLSSLADDCGMTHNTAKAWISILEATYIVFLLRPHHKNFNKRLIKMPKLYFYDTGLACFLLGLTHQKEVATHYLRGALFENLIISEIMKYRLNRGEEPNCYFWRDKTGNEIDCLLESSRGLVPIEIKAGHTINQDYFSGINYWSNLSGAAPSSAYVVYAGNENQKRTTGHVLGWENVTDVFK